MFDFFQFGSLEESSARENVDVVWDQFEEPMSESVSIVVVIKDETETHEETSLGAFV